MKPGALRPAVHAGLLALALLEPYLGRKGMAGAAFGAFLLNLLVLPRTSFGRALRREGEPRWNGLVAYPLAVALAYALFPPVAASVGWAVMALGDPAAALVGRSRPWTARIPWNRKKSVPGTLAFLGAACAGAYLAVALQAGSPVALVGALVGALVESLPFPGDDNLPVTLCAAAAAACLV